MAKRGSSEQKKKMLLVVAGALFVFVLIYQFFINPPARPTRKTRNANVATAPNAASPSATPGPSPARAQAPKPGSIAEEEILLQQQLADLTPLNLSLISSGGGPKISERGNIFAYYVPPPPPPVPAPLPPPIMLQAVSPQNAIAGTPRQLTVTVTGQKIPDDPQIFFDGRAKQTKRINESQLTTVLEPGDYAFARSINIEVKSQSDPVKNNSNTITFVVQPAPEPQFRYIGRLGESGVFEITGSKEIKRLTRGDVLQGGWRIDSITDTGVDLTHTQLEIKRRVPLQDKGR
jgi:hypothetical protein